MQRKSIVKYLFHPIFTYAMTIFFICMALYYSKLVKVPLFSYLIGVTLGLPVFYIEKLLLKKNIENFAQFHTMRIKDRLKSKNPYFDIRNTTFLALPFFILLIVVRLISPVLKINGGMALLGSLIWHILPIPENKKIFNRMNELLKSP